MHTEKQTTRKFRLTHKLFISCCHTSISLYFLNLHSVIVVVVSRCSKVSCYSAFFWNAVDRNSPVLCIFHIFFVFTLKTVIYHLSTTTPTPSPLNRVYFQLSKETVGGYFFVFYSDCCIEFERWWRWNWI